jgi:Peptidase family M48
MNAINRINIISDTSSCQIQKDLVSNINSEYDILPRLPRTKTAAKIAKFFLKILTIIILPLGIAETIAGSCVPRRLVKKLLVKNNEMSPLCQQRMRETEKKIQDLAEKWGLKNSKKIKLLLARKIGVSPAACGTPFAHPTVFLSAEYLVKPEDLPEHLTLSKLDNGTLTEDQWIDQFEKWLFSSFMPTFDKKPKSKLEWDSRRESLKMWLNTFRNQKQFKDEIKFILGHELAHIKHSDSVKRIWQNFGLRFFSVITGGLLLVLTNKIGRALSRIAEKKADLFSARKTGKAKAGIQFFSNVQEVRKRIGKKYSEIAKVIDESGDPIKPSTHPKESERIRYLTPSAA